MEEDMSIADFSRWKVEVLRDFLRKRGIPHSSKRKEELVALVYAAYTEKKPEVITSDEARRLKAGEYQQLLLCGSYGKIPDPLNDLKEGWVSEQNGMKKWPPTMQIDIASYILSHVQLQDRDLGKRLMSDYKEGKAYSYFDSKWLKEVWYHDINQNSQLCVLRSESTPSQKINNISHKIWVAIDKKTGAVANAYCTCFAGLGSTCNHVAAVLFKIEFAWKQGWTNEACTSRPCQWNNYEAKRKVEPKRVTEMEWRKPHYRKQALEKTGINPRTRQLFSPRRKSSSLRVPSIQGIMAAMYSSCPQACAFRYVPTSCLPQYSPAADFNVSHTIEVATSVQIPPSLVEMAAGETSVEAFLSKLPTFSEAVVKEIETITRNQSDSEEWKRQRVGRVTSSTAHRVMTKVHTIRSESSRSHDASVLINQIMGYTHPPEYLPALKYGRTMENEARNKYKSLLSSTGHSQVCVSASGLCISRDNIFIAASPDGFVECQCCGQGLVEIKCPLTVAHLNPASENVNLPYIKRQNGQVVLSKNHVYYSQIQCQLGVTGRLWCDFFVYSRHGHIIIRVLFDEERWNDIESCAVYFFHNHIAPELTKKEL